MYKIVSIKGYYTDFEKRYHKNKEDGGIGYVQNCVY